MTNEKQNRFLFFQFSRRFRCRRTKSPIQTGNPYRPINGEHKASMNTLFKFWTTISPVTPTIIVVQRSKNKVNNTADIPVTRLCFDHLHGPMADHHDKQLGSYHLCTFLSRWSNALRSINRLVQLALWAVLLIIFGANLFSSLDRWHQCISLPRPNDHDRL